MASDAQPLLGISQEALEAIQSAVCVKNHHGIILACNQSFKNLNPLSPTNLVGLTAHDYLPSKEAALFAKADVQLLNNPLGYLNYQFERRHASGSAVVFNTHKSLAQAEGYAPQIIVVINPGNPNNRTLKKSLTPRETTILELLIKGQTQKQIALALGISPHTAADYLKCIYRKLDVHTRTQAQLIGMTQLGLG